MSVASVPNGTPQLNGHPPHAMGQPQQPHTALTRERAQQIFQRYAQMKQQGHTLENSPDFAKLHQFIQTNAWQLAQARHQPAANGVVMNGVGMQDGLGSAQASSEDVTASYPQPPHSPVSFSDAQINALRAQIAAFKRLQRNLPVPEEVLRNIHVADSGPSKSAAEPPLAARMQDAALKLGVDTGSMMSFKAEPDDGEDGQPRSEIHPYNAFIHPSSLLKLHDRQDETKLQRLLIPSIMPLGLDAHQIMAERERFIEARIEYRIQELSNLPLTMSNGDMKPPFSVEDDNIKAFGRHSPKDLTHTARGKLRAVIELKALKLREKQRLLRRQIVERFTHGTLTPLDRKDFRRARKPTLKDARLTDELEQKQRKDRERRAKQKHLDYLNTICTHGRDMIATNRGLHVKAQRVGKLVANYHAVAEKEEQKRVERISKERLKALKADDEEAYLKLIDTAKDTRITHLLRQTDAYLDSLAVAVAAQQSEARVSHDVDLEDGPVDETVFGAQRLDEGEDKSRTDYYSIAHKIAEKVTAQPSILVGGTLKEYQVKGLQWMVSLYNNRLNGILADEMGLGKTIQTISLITFLIEKKRQKGPFLVIVPLSTMTNWSAEFAKWAPTVKTLSYKGSPPVRRQLQNDIRLHNFQVLLTTYEYIIKDRPVLCKLKWVHMIIDEGHRMKNTQSKLTQTLTTYYTSRHRLILTGTPLQNNLPELWALLNFVLPRIFNSVKSFDEWFNTPFANTGDKVEINEEEALLIIRRLHKVLRPFLLRRLKKDVESELPDKVEKVIKIKMSALQSQLYKQMKKHKMIAAGGDNKGKVAGVKGLSNELMQLRKICQHPFLFDSVEDNVNPTGMIDDKLVRTSGKVELLSRILPKFFATGHRILIFFQMTKVMDIMEDFMKMQGYKYLRLDGGTKTDERASHVQLFNAQGSEYQVFILSTRAGGLGLNLQTADTVIIFDSDWNPHADLQAQDRAHRIGQTKAVRILRFIMEKSVEEAMYQRARYKLDIDEKVIQAGRFDNKTSQEEQEEFLRAILEADQEEETEESGEMNDDEINDIIARNDEEVARFREIDMQRNQEADNRWRVTGMPGPRPPPLITVEELPACYQTDEPFIAKDEEDIMEGRGHRRRNVVSYNDGLSDEQFALALEGDEDLQDVIERNRERERRRTARSTQDNSLAGTPEPSSRRGKKGKSRLAEVEFELGNGKRKRGQKAMSVTPSVADEDEDDRDAKRRRVKGGGDVSATNRARMKNIFNECYRAVQNCEDETGRKRCDLFKELPDRRDYPDYYTTIKSPIAMSHLRKRGNSNYYKTVTQYRDDWTLMFNNARTYNQEGSWVYNDAVEMENVLVSTFNRLTRGSGLPGAEPGDGTYVDIQDDAPIAAPTRSRPSRRQVQSDDEYLSEPSDS